MNKLVYKIGVIFFAVTSLSACFKAKRTEIRIDQETKDYCLFGEGSYWIYQDSATFAVDSIVVDKPIKYNLYESGEHNKRVWEKYSTQISLYTIDSLCGFYVELSNIGADEHSLIPCMFFTFRAEMYHNGKIGDGSPTKFKEKKDYLIINGVTYNDIKIFEHHYPFYSQNANKKEIYYWAKHVGLIREEIYEYDSLISVRNLIKYNVKPYNQ